MASDQVIETVPPPVKKSGRAFPEPTVGALVIHKGKVLLLKSPKWKGWWTTAGGHIEMGETAAAALRREMKEEIGVDVSVKRVLAIQEAIYSPLFWKKKHFLFIDFLCEAKTARVRIDGVEITAYRWVDPKKALRMKLEPYFRNLVNAYLEGGTDLNLE